MEREKEEKEDIHTVQILKINKVGDINAGQLENIYSNHYAIMAHYPN